MRAQRPADHDHAEQRRLLLASAVWHAGQVGQVQLLYEHLGALDLVVAVEAATWLTVHDEAASARAPRPALLGDLPFRPAWLTARCPAEARDALTGALDRVAFVDDPAAPLVSDAPRAAPMGDWLVDIDLFGLRRIPDLYGIPPGDQVLVDVTACLQRCVGDRVARWGGDEWLVRLEPDVDALAVAEALRAAVAALEDPVQGGDPIRVTASIGVGRADTWAQAIIRASTAMALAAQEGGDRVRQAT